MMSTAARSRFPFTANQWQELEHQALIYKYMVSGMPVPPDLLYTIRRSMDSSLSSKLVLHQPHHSTLLSSPYFIISKFSQKQVKVLIFMHKILYQYVASFSIHICFCCVVFGHYL